jgi:hypothetical protein
MQYLKRVDSIARGQQIITSRPLGKCHTSIRCCSAKSYSLIFRENNAPGRVARDTIDLHGQFVGEAENILEERIRYAKSINQTHIHVIVGKGNHSAGHIAKIKPRVEQICDNLGLQHHTEQNEGRIYINLTGGAVDYGAVRSWGGYQQNH